MMNNVLGTLNYQTSRFLPMSLTTARGVNNVRHMEGIIWDGIAVVEFVNK